MISSRAVLRATRAARSNTAPFKRNARRFADAPRPQEARPGAPNVGNSPGSSNSGQSGGGGSAAAYGAVGGVVASVAVFALWYQVSGVGKTAKSLQQVKGYVDNAVGQLEVQFKENMPDSNEALNVLKDSAYKYAAFIPGGREYVDKIFKDVEVVRKKHGKEVDKIVQKAYGELRDASKNGLSLETASQAWSILSKYLQELSSLAVDAGQDILNNHPELQNKLGGSFDQLKQLGDKLGPEAKKQVEDSYQEIRDIINQGIQWDTVDKIRKLAQDKVEALKKLRDQTWDQAYQQILPLLKNNPQVKNLVEDNIDTLKNGNIGEATEKVKQALSSGESGSLQEYIDSAKQTADQAAGGSLDKWLTAIPGGSAIIPQLQKLRQIAESKGPEAEKLAKDTMGDIEQVFKKRSAQVEELVRKSS